MSSTEATNRGKDFEGVIKEAFLSVKDTVMERLPDPTNGYLGVRNKSDFLMYHLRICISSNVSRYSHIALPSRM